jgi:glycosyltransferase involved in cell wall biosynthesis
MRIVIDMQGAQSIGSRARGIGRYTMSLSKAMVLNRGEHEIILALSGLHPDATEPIRASFYGLLPQENIRVWDAPGPVDYLSAPKWRQDIAEHIREHFIASLNPDAVLISSLFEGLGDNAVTSIGRICPEISTAVILYDLIPYIHRTLYLQNPVAERWYLKKVDHLRRADLLLAISETSRQEAIRHLGFDDASVVNISTAADAQFSPRNISSLRRRKLQEYYGLKRPFVMYTGGIDHRKNIEGLIRAYAGLPKDIRRQHQLAIVCSIEDHDRQRLIDLGEQQGLEAHDLIITGFVPEQDLVDLYNLCTVFAFASWHEGFGLPALEAMSCGAPVIGANTSSLPEVIGRQDALFDPHDDEAIRATLFRVLADNTFRQLLAFHGLEQAKRFSWDTTAKRALSAFEWCHRAREGQHRITLGVTRPKLAYISPLPPERSGVSDYSAELLPELSRYYDIDVVVAQKEVRDPYITASFPIRTADWFRKRAYRYHRVLYHFGNSSFHQHMFGLLQEVPGVVVLHDFFLSHIVEYMATHSLLPNGNGWPSELYTSHGYDAVRHYAKHSADLAWRYPCNLSVLQQTQGIIAHSVNSLRLAEQWYGADSSGWRVVPHLRVSRIGRDKIGARKALGFGFSDFLVCSFGLTGPIKQNHRLLEAWLRSRWARDRTCRLIFVGENDRGEYGKELLARIRRDSIEENVRITGWVNIDVFRQYLAAADIAVQLRTLSRGETSGTILDCMNYGLPTIINAHGSMAELDDDAVWKLPDNFTDVQLIEALETLWQDAELRKRLGARAQKIIVEKHNPRTCAAQYYQAIERFNMSAASGIRALVSAIAGFECTLDDRELTNISEAIARSIPQHFRVRQLLLDVSELVQRDLQSGIQRVVRSILTEWLNHPPAGYRIEPIYATVDRGYRYARRFTLSFLGCPDETLPEEPIEYTPGDVFFGLDLQIEVIPTKRAFYQELRRHGVRVVFLVHDLLCIQMPQLFPPGSMEGFARWLEVVAESDGAVCVSKTVADELAGWCKENGPARQRPLEINWSHNGGDIENSAPTKGLPVEAQTVLNRLGRRSSFLMVGTLEPRKAHAQVLDAFDQLWQSGLDVNLVMVGKQGWMVESLVERVGAHPELNKRLFWLKAISDEYLERVYGAATCLIAASEGEGFGLPLIESARHKLPIIARDIPVFREVAGEHAFYFAGRERDALSVAIKEWLALYHKSKHPKSEAMPWMTWTQSVERLQAILLRGDWYGDTPSKSRQSGSEE